MIERRPPTHILRIEVPLASTGEDVFDQRAFAEALRVVLALSTVAVRDELADTPTVTIVEATPQ